jgi:hypothetical protein
VVFIEVLLIALWTPNIQWTILHGGWDLHIHHMDRLSTLSIDAMAEAGKLPTATDTSTLMLTLVTSLCIKYPLINRWHVFGSVGHQHECWTQLAHGLAVAYCEYTKRFAVIAESCMQERATITSGEQKLLLIFRSLHAESHFLIWCLHEPASTTYGQTLFHEVREFKSAPLTGVVWHIANQATAVAVRMDPFVKIIATATAALLDKSTNLIAGCLLRS